MLVVHRMSQNVGCATASDVCGMSICLFAVLAPSVMATVSCVANVLLVVIVVVISVKCYHLRHQGQCVMYKGPINTLHRYYR